jgi:hypothetical protein
MKNIHVIPTDKPSRLYYNGTSYKDPNSTIAMDWFISSALYKPQNIYITSDEEIKEGDWIFSTKTNNLFKANVYGMVSLRPYSKNLINNYKTLRYEYR